MINPVTPIYRKIEIRSPSYRVEKAQRKDFGDTLREQKQQSNLFEQERHYQDEQPTSQESKHPIYEEIMDQYLVSSQYRPPIMTMETEMEEEEEIL